ncbi:MAG: hypothetical protein ABIJ61_05975 [bacterium]
MLLVNATEFSERVEQELARAQRYCLYLSLLVLDFAELPEAPSGTASAVGALPSNLSENLKAVLRCSDLVAISRGGRLAVLLVETPASGLAVVRERICDFVSDFLEDRTEAQMPIHSAVYPDATTDFKRLLASLRARAQVVN